jgi:phage-related protein
MGPKDRPLVWLEGEIKTPPLSAQARLEAGYVLRLLQQGQSIRLPHSRPMPSIGSRCHELRIQDRNLTWRIVYRVDLEAIVILDVFEKKTRETPTRVVRACKVRLSAYDQLSDS